MAEPIIILQDAIMAYRKPFYNALAEHYDVCVVHSGKATVEAGDRYREQIVPLRRHGGVAMQEAAAALARAHPKAVIAMFDLRWPATLWAAWRSRSARRLLWGHRYSSRGLANPARDWVMRRFDGVIQYGEEEVPAMIARGVDRHRIFIAPNTIDVPNHADCSRADKCSFLFVGRLQPRKRLDELLRAFADVRDRIPADARLEFVGDGEIRANLEALADEMAIGPKVIFHGPITDGARLKPIFARAFAYVSPDNVGLGVLHAFAYGVPVITSTPRGSREPGYRHGPEFHNLVPGENALLFDNGAELRELLIAVAVEDGLAQRLGGNAYARYCERGIRAMVDGFRRAIEWPRQPPDLVPAGRD
jgi:glycosyltransferase involved in cell wall biosynthesis